jgi:hypothetical protein
LAARANTGTLVPLTALGDLSPRESAVLTADLARLASALPMDTVAAFRGLPFVVRAAHVARVGGRVLLVAEVTRRVAQAASPLEQRVAVVADRDTTPGARWTPQWWERVDGSEETIEATDAVGVVAAAPGVAVLLQRESSRGVRYELVWGEGGTWGRRWTSGWGGC